MKNVKVIETHACSGIVLALGERMVPELSLGEPSTRGHGGSSAREGGDHDVSKRRHV